MTTLGISDDGAVRRIEINRPDALNALNLQVRTELLDAVRAAAADDGVRVLVLAGSGEKAFAAGADIKEMIDSTPGQAEALSRAVKLLHDAIRHLPKPVIASINGFCLGGGFELALACDLRIAGETAKFGLPEIKLGIMPGAGGTVRLTRLVGPSWARRLCLTGDMIGAAEARALGIVTDLVPPAELAEATAKLARQLAGLSRSALAQLKGALNVAAEADLDTAEALESKAFALCFASPDQREGMEAFVQKRKPRFQE